MRLGLALGEEGGARVGDLAAEVSYGEGGGGREARLGVGWGGYGRGAGSEPQSAVV